MQIFLIFSTSRTLLNFNTKDIRFVLDSCFKSYVFCALRDFLLHFYNLFFVLSVKSKSKNEFLLRAMKTVIRKKMGFTTKFRLIKPHQWPCNDPATKARGNRIFTLISKDQK